MQFDIYQNKQVMSSLIVENDLLINSSHIKWA